MVTNPEGVCGWKRRSRRSKKKKKKKKRRRWCRQRIRRREKYVGR